MFGIGSWELLMIALVALLVIGPQKLPQVMRTLGKGFAEFKRMSNDVKNTLNAEVELAERKAEEKKSKAELFPDGAASQASAPQEGVSDAIPETGVTASSEKDASDTVIDATTTVNTAEADSDKESASESDSKGKRA